MASARIHFPFHKNPICKGAHSEDAIAGSNLFSFFSVQFKNTSQFPEKLLEQIRYREIFCHFYSECRQIQEMAITWGEYQNFLRKHNFLAISTKNYQYPPKIVKNMISRQYPPKNVKNMIFLAIPTPLLHLQVADWASWESICSFRRLWSKGCFKVPR